MTVTGQQLQKARKALHMTQMEAAKKLGISQTYLSLFELGKRPLTDRLTKKAVRVFNLPPTALPVKSHTRKMRAASNQDLVKDLAALNYPGYSHVAPSRRKNPVQVLISALSADNLKARLVESLPWVLLEFSDIEWKTLVDAAKLQDLQNRLGFLTALARKLAERSGDSKKAAQLRRREQSLESSRLVKEDTLCRTPLTNVERRWILQHRSEEAAHWNILSDLSAENLSYAE